MSQNPVVHLLDDDLAVLDSLSMLIAAVGYAVKVFSKPAELLQSLDTETVGCLILDVRMPVVSGLTVQNLLLEQDKSIPIIFITGHADVESCSRAFRSGAVDFLRKPIDEAELLASIRKAIKLSIESHVRKSRIKKAQELQRLLTEREKGVLGLIVEGLSNKEIARTLNLSVRTVEAHRAAIFEKTGVTSLAELVAQVLALYFYG